VSGLRGVLPSFTHELETRCSLAIVEGVNNAIFHAHKKDKEEWIDIKMWVEGKKLFVEIWDYGEGFELSNEADLPIDATHGRGLFIIKSVMDSVSYKRGNRCNKLVMSCSI